MNLCFSKIHVQAEELSVLAWLGLGGLSKRSFMIFTLRMQLQSSQIRMERGRKMLVDKKRKCLERARIVSRLASMIA
uniref:Uncharacterized protein n=1 Tax=Aegilops tauschii subsp. strangulata TaxID=200361 RepID=A0A453D929_AEGTS